MPPRSRSKPSAPVPVNKHPAPIEEEIDFGNVSSDDDDIPNPKPAKAAVRAGGVDIDEERTNVAPIVKPVVNKSNRALDVDLLFDRAKGKPSVCKVCK